MNARSLLLLCVGLAPVAPGPLASEPEGIAAGLRIHPFVVAAGGGRATGGDFVLTGTAGQVVATSRQIARGGVATPSELASGFWPARDDLLFKDGFEPSMEATR